MKSEIFMWQVHYMLKGEEASKAGVWIFWLHARKGVGQLKECLDLFFSN